MKKIFFILTIIMGLTSCQQICENYCCNEPDCTCCTGDCSCISCNPAAHPIKVQLYKIK